MKASQILEASDNAVVTRGRTAEFKSSQYFLGIVINSVVYPDLNNAELQDSYGVMDSYSLINAMLNAEEFQRLQTECNKINGLDKTFKDLKDEVKN
ncbi:Phage XkdN-like tail assembly chaperone protein, TAC [Peptoniphilus asaccharolyticus DSM 20463]|uniref:Phage XkdN-like tail assembly chaperone protein, TAC n=1 Tax=Peptoniphilus asaccharolyticus DSM 20463 TaxID=573058 RepID=A0A1W1V188_PEPAS|nr:Phage XkdN-like tail assembly chaperone protein, TAC [Peptoniphilus asaccharolyticus DSM 20463]